MKKFRDMTDEEITQWVETHFHKILWWAFSIFCWTITPGVFNYAASQRAIPGLGGELFIPLAPLLLLAAWDTWKKDRQRTQE